MQIVTVETKGMKKFYELVAYLFFAWCGLNVSRGFLPEFRTGTQTYSSLSKWIISCVILCLKSLLCLLILKDVTRQYFI